MIHEVTLLLNVEHDGTLDEASDLILDLVAEDKRIVKAGTIALESGERIEDAYDRVIELHTDMLNDLQVLIHKYGEVVNGAVDETEVGYELEHTDVVIVNVHDSDLCEGRVCCIHNKTDHHMRDCPQHWRSDSGVMERICAHGVGHPDPDSREYLKTREDGAFLVHGCDGCCVD